MNKVRPVTSHFKEQMVRECRLPILLRCLQSITMDFKKNLGTRKTTVDDGCFSCPQIYTPTLVTSQSIETPVASKTF